MGRSCLRKARVLHNSTKFDAFRDFRIPGTGPGPPLRPVFLFAIIGTDEVHLIKDRSPGLRTALISAITACADDRLQKKARWFLQGLSNDELQYIAEFLGACVLESSRQEDCMSRRELADGIAQFDRFRSAPCGVNDREHKMIVLLEYLCRCKLTRYALAVRAERTL